MGDRGVLWVMLWGVGGEGEGGVALLIFKCQGSKQLCY